MQVLAINSSPRQKGVSKTGMMLSHLVEGMRKAGAEVHTVNLSKKTVKNCIGCYTCWTKTPGRCIHRDDMSNELYPRLLKSDIVIYATPLYHFTMNATLKAFIERTLPVVQPFMEQKDGVTRHPLRERHPAVVMLSVAGFPEMSIFDQLSSHVRYLFGPGLIAEIYRPAAEMLDQAAFGDVAEDILQATVQAGGELVRDLRITPKTLEHITQPITDSHVLREAGNLFWKTCIDAGVTPAEFTQQRLVPRPDSIATFMLIMRLGFKAQASRGIKAVIQFVFSGPQEGTCHFRIADGTCTPSAGAAPLADLTIWTPFEDWMDLTTGKTDGQALFAAGICRAEGDSELLLHLQTLFGG